MTRINEPSIAERVALGSAFLDRHFTGWWERIDLNILDIDSCEGCVLGQLWCTSPQEEAGQIMAQAVAHFIELPFYDLETATEAATRNTPYGIISTAFDELRYSRTYALGFNYATYSIFARTEVEALTDEWTRLIIQRRLDAHPDVLLGLSALTSIPTESLVAV